MQTTTTSGPEAPTRGAALVTSAIAVALGALETVAGAYFWLATVTSTSEDPLVGIGYVFAIFIGVPGILGLVLGGLGWRLARRTGGLVLGILGLVVAATVALQVLWFMSPTF